MTLDQLDAFLAVARAGSFTAGSAHLHKTQPAVSKLVRHLEDELGLQLFDRRAYRATLTDAGRRFFERAAALRESAEALRGFALELAGEIEPIVRLAVEAVTPLPPVLAVLRGIQGRFPNVRFEVRTERLSGALEALEHDAADLAVATTLGLDRRRMEVRRVAVVPIVPVVRADHPLAAPGGATPETLRMHAQIVLSDSAQGASTASLNVLEGGLRWTVTDVAAKHEVIAAGMGWGGLPEHVVAEGIARGTLVALDVPEFETDRMELFAIRRRDRPHGVVASALWEALASTLGATPRGAGSSPGRSAAAPSRAARGRSARS